MGRSTPGGEALRSPRDHRKWYCHRCGRFVNVRAACPSCGHVPRGGYVLPAGAEDGAQARQLEALGREMRGQLTLIIGYMHLMELGQLGVMTPEQRECVRVVASSAGNLVNLVNQLPDLASEG